MDRYNRDGDKQVGPDRRSTRRWTTPCGLVLSVVFALPLLLHAAPTTPPVTNELSRLSGIYESAKAKIETKHASQVADLPAQYGKALDALEKVYQEHGDLKGVLSVHAERDAFSKAGTASANPLPGEPQELSELRAKQLAGPATLAAGQRDEMARLTAAYVSRLTELQKEWTRRGLIKEALAIQTQIDSLRAAPAPAAAANESAQATPSWEAEPTAAARDVPAPPPVSTALPAPSANRSMLSGAGKASTPAILYIACDNSHTAWLNGKLISEGSSFAELMKCDIKVKQGDVLAVRAVDREGGRAGGFYCCIVLKDARMSLGTSRHWLCSATNPPDNWKKSQDVRGFLLMTEDVKTGVSQRLPRWKDDNRLLTGQEVWSESKTSPIWFKYVVDFDDFSSIDPPADGHKNPPATANGVEVKHYLGEGNRIIDLDPDANLPDELKCDVGGNRVSIYGTCIYDVVTLKGQSGGWLGKAAFLPTTASGGTISAKIRPDTQHVRYDFLLRTLDGLVHSAPLSVLSIAPTMTWRVEKTKDRCTVFVDGKGVNAAKLLETSSDNYLGVGIAATVRWIGDQADISCTFR